MCMSAAFLCWSRLKITRRTTMPANAGIMVQIPGQDVPTLWHNVQIPAWVALVSVMAVLLEIFVLWFAFTLGTKYPSRSTVHARPRCLPTHMLKSKTGDRLHLPGCFHLQQSEKEDTVLCVQICDTCRNKAKEM